MDVLLSCVDGLADGVVGGVAIDQHRDLVAEGGWQVGQGLRHLVARALEELAKSDGWSASAASAESTPAAAIVSCL